MSALACSRTADGAGFTGLTIVYELVTAFSRATSIGDVYRAANTRLLAAADRATILVLDTCSRMRASIESLLTYLHSNTVLSQVLHNFISKVIKYRRKEFPGVHVAAEERDGWSIFSVRGNGIGIQAQLAKTIFARLSQFKRRNEYGGTGIGLGICHRILEQYGGRIWLEQRVSGRGSTFCFSAPRAAR